MLYTKAFLVLEKKIFKCFFFLFFFFFFTVHSHESHLRNHLNPSTEGLMCNLVETGQVILEKMTFTDYIIAYKYIARGQGQTPRGTKF